MSRERWCPGGCGGGAPPPGTGRAPPAPGTDAQRAAQRRLQAAQSEVQLLGAGLGAGKLRLRGGQAALRLTELQAGLRRPVLRRLRPQRQVACLVLQLLLAAAGFLELSRELPFAAAPAAFGVRQAPLQRGHL